MRKLTHEEIVGRQFKASMQKRAPVSVVLDNIRSLNNVGAIFRSADGAGIEKIWLCGITGYPPQGDISKTALGAEESVAWAYARSAMDVIHDHRARGYQILLLEQAEGSIPYDEFVPRSPVCLVVGNEVDGVADELVRLADAAIEIPMCGVKNSLNVAVAFGVVAFRLTRAFDIRA
ncbi:MAG: RNA methyltransferase [Candidatus Omnitrophica bacterium]|nr:RNA methyltransferase [Candidatus Omnitrophota bacterium]